MLRTALPTLLAGALGLALWSAWPASAHAQCASCGPYGGGGGGGGPFTAPGGPCPDCPRFFHYPFYYFPWNYWPAQGPQWPEPPGKCYMPPPAYMAFPPFKEDRWRYEYWEPQRFYRGSHFLLDIF
jgi:hypothetical protein